MVRFLQLPTWALTLLTLASLCVAVGCDPAPAVDPDRALADGGATDAVQGADLGASADAAPDAEVEARLNSVFPNRAPVPGQVSVRIVGRGFVDGMRVRLGRKGCLDIQVVTENHIQCTVPEAEAAGEVDLILDWPDDGGTESLENAFTYFQPVELTVVEPQRGPAAGGILVTLRGQGFVVGTEVTIGQQRATIESLDEEGREVVVRCPPGEPGVVDVSVSNLNGESTIPGGFTWFEDLIVDDISPQFGPLSGGNAVRLAGVGLSAESLVEFGAESADVLSSEFERRALRVEAPPAAAPGAVDVVVTNVNGRWTLPSAYLYLPEEDGPFAVYGVAPNRLPTDGGESFWLGGNGFTADTEVELDGRSVGCVLETAQRLRCTPGPREAGTVNLTVREGERRHEALNAITFYRRVEVYDLSPERGSVAGGTLVEIIGRGLEEETVFEFEGEALEVVELVDEGQVFARTPNSRPGWVSLTARTDDDRSILPLAFEYFDPGSQYGGIWGEPIVNSINITVVDQMTGQVLPDSSVVVQGLSDARGRWTGVTNANGQLTISDPELSLPVAATAAHEGYTTTTFERITNENATLVLAPLEPPMGEGEMEPIEPVTLRGQLVGLNELEKPINEGFVLVAFIETSHSEPGNRLGASPPLPNGLLVEDGPFEIVVPPGEFAVVATAGYVPAIMKSGYEQGQVPFWTFRDALQSTHMGLRRFISGQPGDTIEGLNVALDIPLDQTVDVRLGNPSGGVRGAPDAFVAHAILALGADGYFDFRYQIAGDSHVFQVDALPDVTEFPDPDVTMRWEGEAEQTNPEQLYRFAWATTSARDMSEGVTIGPFVGTTDILEPRHRGTMNPFRWVEWRTLAGIDGPMAPPEPADIHMVRVSDGNSILWSHWVPGAANRFQYPQLPGEQREQDLPNGQLQLSVYSLLIDGPFQFDDFSFLDFNRLRSYSFSYVQFTR